jgi:hypothetical protein
VQPAKIGEPVLVVEEAGRPIVPALDDVKRQSVDRDAWAARHAASPVEIEPGPLSPFSPRCRRSDCHAPRRAQAACAGESVGSRGRLSGEGAEGLFDQRSADIPRNEDQARAPILAGPGRQQDGRVKDVLDALHDDGLSLALDIEDALDAQDVAADEKPISSSSQSSRVASGMGFSTVKQKARIWSSCRFTSWWS